MEVNFENNSSCTSPNKVSGNILTFKFEYGSTKLTIVDKYKYLGLILNEYLYFSYVSESFYAAGSRALGSITIKSKIFGHREEMN